MKDPRILYHMHVMWYESKMINETLESLQLAVENSTIPVDIMICLNSQTYMEQPDGVVPVEMFNEFVEHPVLKNATLIHKTDNDPFYNVGDWRRDLYGPDYDYKYIVWGESDGLVPEDHFFLLAAIDIDHPHYVSLASRKMWDSTWDEVEHPWLRQFPRNGPPDNPAQAPEPFNSGHYISLNQLNEFNRQFEPVVIQLQQNKIDGNLIALSKGLPYPFIPPDLRFCREDLCAQIFFTINGIPQYHISTRLKGHNYVHPNKRIGTKDDRSNTKYTNYNENIAPAIINNFLREAQTIK